MAAVQKVRESSQLLRRWALHSGSNQCPHLVPPTHSNVESSAYIQNWKTKDGADAVALPWNDSLPCDWPAEGVH